MTFKEKISKIVRFNKLGIDSPSGLESYIKAGVGTITKPIKNNEEPGEGTIKKILALPGLNKTWWKTGERIESSLSGTNCVRKLSNFL